MTVIDRNPLYKALRDKSSQLKKCGYKGPMGIVVCDGGTRALNEPRNVHGYSTSEVIQHFLQRNSTVNFVVVLVRIEELSRTVKHRLEPRIHVRRAEPWHAKLENVFSTLSEGFPQINQSPDNAQRERKHYKGRETMRPHLGGFSISMGRSKAEIRMSTRTLLDLLSGRLTQERFSEAHQVGGDRNVFENLLRQAFALREATVDRRPDEDDDEIVLQFQAPDPAIALFRIKDNEDG